MLIFNTGFITVVLKPFQNAIGLSETSRMPFFIWDCC